MLKFGSNNVPFYNKHVIGIRDKDYLENEISPKIFFYDNCCLEMMIVENEECFTSICNEFYKGNLSSYDLLRNILNDLKFLSAFRMCNERFKWEINFRSLSICKVFDKNKIKIMKDHIIDELNKSNSNVINNDKINKVNSLVNEINTFFELLKITQGHDFSAAFSTICNIYINKHINFRSVELALRCSYKKNEFKESRLHNVLWFYQENIKIAFLNT